MKRLMFVVVCGFTASIAAQQAPQKFEVTSVKRNYVPGCAATDSDHSHAGPIQRDERDTARCDQTRLLSHRRPDDRWSRLDEQTKFNVEGTAPGAKPEEIRPTASDCLPTDSDWPLRSRHKRDQFTVWSALVRKTSCRRD